MKPSRSAELFAAALIADPQLRESVLGDLAEDHERIAREHSPAFANRWYWSQLVRSAIPFSFMAVNRGGIAGWLRFSIATVIGYVAIAMSVVVTDTLVTKLIVAIGVSWPILPPWQYLAGSVAAGMVSGLFAGYVAALIGGRSPIAPALALGALCSAFAALLMAKGGFGGPAWYQLSMLLIVLPATVCGALLRARQMRGLAR